MRSTIGLFILLAISLLVDFYVFMAVRAVSADASPRNRIIIYSIYWVLSFIALASIIGIFTLNSDGISRNIKTHYFSILLGLFLAKLITAIFLLLDDIRRLFQWIYIKIFVQQPTSISDAHDNSISRSVFLSWLGMAVGTTFLGTLIYGFSNKYSYVIKRKKLFFKNLPDAFDGFKMVHISDIHAGSFTNKSAVEKGIKMILNEQSDLIIFSGDLVNDRATEMAPYMDTFSKIKAPYGVYSTLGNHDYGDYVQWPHNGISKKENLENLKKIHADLGWKLLMNEHVVIEKNQQQIAVLGVENWGSKARFPKYGDLKKAHLGAESIPFKVLISHDPSHWDAQIRPQYPDIDLTLSGHTHGMQFGVDIPGLKWSPVQYVYKHWAGLYQENNQQLYVNTGFGFLGYPGRVGILPEITVLELKKS